MKISIDDVKKHILAFLGREALVVEGVEHKLVQRFAAFIEGKQAEQDAIAYLTSKGYSVIAPPAAAEVAKA